MTAIVAFAGPGIAFVAGDTRRAGALFSAVKVHTWGPQTLLAQAGNAHHQSNLIAHMMRSRGSVFNTDFQGFVDAYRSFHPAVIASASSAAASQNLVSLSGTLLVADGNLGKVVGFDFQTGNQLSAQVKLSAGAPNVQTLAAQAWGVGRRDLDGWAMDTIDPLCDGVSVDWPIDLLISRPDTSGFKVVGKRLASRSTSSFPDFAV